MFGLICRAAGIGLVMSCAVSEARELLRPAETPPASYRGQQYVDSKGCLFLRAGTETGVVWIARVTRQGVSVCGYPPSGRRVPIAGETGTTAQSAEPSVSDPGAGFLVAVGRFSVTGNADRAARSMANLGFPVARSQVVQSGVSLDWVFAGPFQTEPAAAEAMRIIRNSGFPDAIIVEK